MGWEDAHLHQFIINWLGGRFDPEALDLEQINKRLKNSNKSWSGKA